MTEAEFNALWVCLRMVAFLVGLKLAVWAFDRAMRWKRDTFGR